MYYYDTEKSPGKKPAVAAAAVYILFWALLMIMVTFSFTPREMAEGMLIDFGDSETGWGLTDPDVSDPSTDVSAAGAAPNMPDEFLTQDFEEAPEIAQPAERPVTTTENTPDRSSRDNTPAPREVDRRTLFPGRTQGSTSTSEGNIEGPGNQGVPTGSPGGSHDGTGTGGGGAGFDLAGRTVIGALPSPVYGSNQEGRVVIVIVVDSNGNVVNATYRAQGSTTNNSELVNAAVRAARQSRFNVIESDGLQTGTITYNFRLR